jgi:hypothetical protein
MELEQISEMIEADSIIDKDKLDSEALKISVLHTKYYKLMIIELKEYKKIESLYNELYKEKVQYYSGKAGDKVYRENPLFEKILKADIDMYLKADKELNQLDMKKAEQKMKIDFIEATIKNINNRSFVISNALNFIKFKNGIN